MYENKLLKSLRILLADRSCNFLLFLFKCYIVWNVIPILYLKVGLSEEPVHQEKEAAGCGSAGGGSGGRGIWEAGGEKLLRRKKKGRASKMTSIENEDESEGAEEDESGSGGGSERQREHPFIVTEPGEVARGKKNGLDYLFHLYEQCQEFLIQVQNIAKDRGEKCPTKVYASFIKVSIHSFSLAW